MKKDDKITVMKEYVSNQTVNAFMKHGVEKYFHEYIIVIDDDWYTPCEFISEFGLEDSFGSEYVFEQVVIAVKSSIKWLKKQGFKPDEDSDDESYNLYMMIDFIKNIKELNQLNESYGLFDYVLNESSSLKESEYRMVGKNSLKEFDNDLNDVVFHFDATMPKRVKESINEGDKFKNKNGAVIEIIEYDEDENYVLYKVNDNFHDTHIDSIENILSKNGYEKLNESNVAIAQWRRDTAERLIKEANKIDPSYSFVEYDIGPKKEIKYKIFKNDNEYVGTFDVFTDEPYNSPYRYFFNHVNVEGLEFQGMNIDEFNKDFNEFIKLD